MKRVLVTGFEPFDSEVENPSALVANALEASAMEKRELSVSGPERPWQLQGRVELKAEILPVSFEESFVALSGALTRFLPDVVICLGQAGGRSCIELERIAVNMIDAEIADNRGVQVRDRLISPGAETAFFSRLPLREIEKKLIEQRIPVRISNSAGLYVCNYVFYKLMEFMRLSSSISGGFIHLPYLPEQAIRADLRRGNRALEVGPDQMALQTPSMEIQTMIAGIKAVIEQLV